MSTNSTAYPQQTHPGAKDCAELQRFKQQMRARLPILLLLLVAGSWFAFKHVMHPSDDLGSGAAISAPPPVPPAAAQAAAPLSSAVPACAVAPVQAPLYAVAAATAPAVAAPQAVATWQAPAVGTAQPPYRYEVAVPDGERYRIKTLINK